MIPKIKSTVIPIEYLNKFPFNDLALIKGDTCTVLDRVGKIIKDGEELLFSTGSTPVCSDSGTVLV